MSADVNAAGDTVADGLSGKSQRSIGAAVYVFLGLLVVLGRFPSLYFHFVDWDEAAIMAQSWAMSTGQVLYRDVAQIHPVLNFAIIVPFFRALPPQMVPFAVKAMNLVLVFLGAVLVARIALEWLESRWLALLGGSIFAYYCSYLWAWSSYGEFYAIFPVLLSVWLLFFSVGLRAKSFVVGCLWAAAFFFKQVAVFDAAGLYLAYLYWNRVTLRVKTSATLYLTLGFLTVTAAVGVWFNAHGALWDAWNSMVIRPFLYTRSGDRWPALVDLGGTALTDFSLSLPMFVGITSLLLRGRKPASEACRSSVSFFIVLCLWLCSDLFAVASTGRAYPHYLLQIAPAASLLPLFVLRPLAERRPALLLTVAVVISTLLTAALSVQFFATMRALALHGWIPAQVRASNAAATFIRDHTARGDRIFLFKADNLDVFFLSQRLSNNGVYMFVDMAVEHMHDQNEQDRRRRAFLASPPAVIVVDPLYEQRGQARREVPRLVSLDFFESILKSNYVHWATVEDLDLYVPAPRKVN